MPLYPSKVLRAKECAPTLCSSVVFCFGLTFGVPQRVRSASRKVLIKNIHEEIGQFSERRTLVEVKKRFFWHDRSESMRMLVRQCQHYRLAKSLENIKSSIEEMKNVPIYEFFYRMALDIAGPLLETKNGNRYALVAVDYYSKWLK
jgi:hypothetical protein